MVERAEAATVAREQESRYDPHAAVAEVIDSYGHWEQMGVLPRRKAGAVFLGVKDVAFKDLPRCIQFAMPMNHQTQRMQRQKDLILGFSAGQIIDGDGQSSQVMVSITKGRTANVLELTLDADGKFLTDMHRVTPQLAWIDYSSTVQMLTQLDLRENLGRFKQKLEQMREMKRSERSFRQAFGQHEAYFINFEEFLYQFCTKREFAEQVWAGALEVLRFFPSPDEAVPGSRKFPHRNIALSLPLFEISKRIAKDSAESGQLPAVTRIAPIFLQGDTLHVLGEARGLKAIGSIPEARRAS